MTTNPGPEGASPSRDPLSGILTPRATRTLLENLDHHPKRQLGQNFLVDGNIVRKSLELARVTSGDRVIEIGPGLGTLTSALLDAGAEVFAVERDATLFDHLRTTLVPASGGRLHLMEGDAVESPLAGLLSTVAGLGEAGPVSPTRAAIEFKIVANLPYAISSPWMEAVLAGPLPERMVLMLQLEAAQRYAATPGTKLFGAISVFLQSAFRVLPGHRVSSRCFHPVPEVDSTLLHLERLEQPYSFSKRCRTLIRSFFQHRRKQLAPLARRAAPEAAERWSPQLAAHGVRPDARPEDVPVACWIEFDQAIAAQD